MKISIGMLDDAKTLAAVLCTENAGAQASWLLHCVKETEEGKGWTIIGMGDNGPVGFISMLNEASYPPFAKQCTPEIHGMAVLPSLRRKGIGQQLLKLVENHARDQGHRQIGLGVGVTQDYQAAFTLYMKAGYLPDGNGLYHADLPHSFAAYGDKIAIDNSTTLWFVKSF